MIYLGYVAALFMGLTLGSIGGGGSILTVPILVYFFHIDPVLASGQSLFIVGMTAAFASIGYGQRKLIAFQTAILFALPSLTGVFLSRSVIVPRLPDPIWQGGSFLLSKAGLIMIVFSMMMIAAAYPMIRGPGPLREGQALSQRLQFQALLKIVFQALLIGLYSGFVGAGGGFLFVPALVLLVGLPMQKAIGTSLLIISIQSLIGFLSDLRQHPHPHWPFLLTLTSLAIAGSLLGFQLGRHIPEKSLKTGFGWFVLLMGCAILLQQLR